MKTITTYIIIAALLLFASSTVSMASNRTCENSDNSSFLLVGGDIGAVQAIINDEEKTTHTGGFKYGPRMTYVWDVDAIIAGISYMRFKARFSDEYKEVGQAENHLSGYMVDLILPINNDSSSNMTYLTLSGGEMSEDYHNTILSYTPYSLTTVQIKNKSPIYSIGFGSMSLPTREQRLSLGAGLRFIHAPELKTANNFFMLNITIGLRIF